MSEYQFYEFRAIDRPLSDEAQAEISRLSSRVELTSSSAIFTYSYADFRGDPLGVLMKHFDMMLYMANWGARQIAFRLPRTMIDTEMIAPYLVDGMIETKVMGKYLLLNIEINDDGDDRDWEWIEGEGWMEKIAPLRADLLRGDYRLLYLAWLATSAIDPDLEEESEPPIPPNLGKLSKPLKMFAGFFDIDQDMIAVAAKASGVETERGIDETKKLIAALPEKERNAYLLRVVEGDGLVSAELARRLDTAASGKQSKRGGKPVKGDRRTAAQLIEAAREHEVVRKKREKEQARKARIRELEKLAEHEEETWDRIASLLSESRAKAHQEAVELLIDLRDLAEHRGAPEKFRQRIDTIIEKNRRRLALMLRFREAGLMD